jgi:hypothetical protein
VAAGGGRHDPRHGPAGQHGAQLADRHGAARAGASSKILHTDNLRAFPQINSQFTFFIFFNVFINVFNNALILW